METSRIGRVVVCRSMEDDKVTGQVKLFWNDKTKHYLSQLDYEEMVKLAGELLEAKAKIDKERAGESSCQEIENLIVLFREGQPTCWHSVFPCM